MIVLGITGGVATGKSTVTRLLADLGAPTVSADALAHDLLMPGTEATRAVLRAFPTCTLPASNPPAIDRRALGRHVFSDSAARRLLESLTHPPIIATLAARTEAWRAQDGVAAAAEIPLLFEANLQWMADKIVVVTCPKSDQVSRLMIRGVDEKAAYRQISAQWSLAKKVKRADYVINTNDDAGLEDTRRQVQALWDMLAG